VGDVGVPHQEGNDARGRGERAGAHRLVVPSNGTPIISFLEKSGSVTYEGSTGSINMTVEYHAVGSTTYGKVATVTGSWNCGS